MTHEDLKATLETAGWRIAKNHLNDGTNEAEWYAWKPDRTSARECVCNDKPPSATVNPYQFDMHGNTHASAEIRLVGEMPNGQWIDFKVYSVPMHEVMDVLPGALKALDAAWVAAWDTAIPKGTNKPTNAGNDPRSRVD